MTFKMKAEPLRLWLEAMESGAYQIGYGRLYDKKPDGTECFCALGVLTDVAERQGQAIPESPFIYDKWDEPEDSDKLLHNSTHGWSGMDVETQSAVARHNDNTKFDMVDGTGLSRVMASMADMAAWVRENFEAE